VATEGNFIRDLIQLEAHYGRLVQPEPVGVFGHGFLALFDEHGRLKDHHGFTNLVTTVGDEVYAKRASGIASPPGAATGMRLGTGTTAVAKTGAGAAIVTYVSGSSVAIDATFPSTAAQGSGWRITYRTTWNAGVATANSISEAVLTNEASLTNVAGTAANTIARVLLSPTVNKASTDTLVVTWNHDFLGA
jgi:hypothetical protein